MLLVGGAPTDIWPMDVWQVANKCRERKRQVVIGREWLGETSGGWLGEQVQRVEETSGGWQRVVG